MNNWNSALRALGVVLALVMVAFQPSRVMAQSCNPARNVADSNPSQIEGCIKTIIADRPGDPFVVRDAGCFSVYGSILREVSLEGERNQSRSDQFCAALLVAQKRVYGSEPFWQSCAGPQSDTPEAIATCILGVMRASADFPLPSEIKSCGKARELHAFAQRYTVLKQESWRDATSDHLDCKSIELALAQLKQREQSPCFMHDRLNVENNFRRCMAGDIAPTEKCESIQKRFNEKYFIANGGYPAGYHPNFHVPYCDFIENLRLEVSAESDKHPVLTETSSDKSKPNPGVVVAATIIAILVIGWIANFLPGLNLKVFGRLGYVLQRIQFQFAPVILFATLGAMIGVAVRYAIALALSLVPIWGIAKLAGATNPLAWAFFVNFVIYAFFSIYSLVLGEKRGLAFFAFYTGLSDSMGKENALGSKLFVEALVRNIIIVELIALTGMTIFSAGASAWAIEKIYGLDLILGDGGGFNESLNFFAGTVLQLLLLEIPDVLGYQFTDMTINTASSSAKLYLIFTKVIVVGGLAEVFIRAASELQKIAEDVGGAIDKTVGTSAAFKRDDFEAPSVALRIRPSIRKPMAFYVGIPAQQ